MKDNWKTIGILGGMGPEATAEFYRRIIGICQKDYGAKFDSDFPPIFIYNMPLPEIVAKTDSRESVVGMIRFGIAKLESVGCDFISVPCNTVTYFLGDVRSKIKLLTPVEEAYKEAKLRGIKRAGVLSTLTTARNRLFEKVFIDIEILQPSETEQRQINEIILRILAGWKDPKDKERLKIISKKLQEKGAQAVILGCTELPLLISQRDLDIEILDTLQILAENAVRTSEVIK